jgi:hypothetical protein
MPALARVALRGCMAMLAISAAVAVLLGVAHWRFSSHLRDAAAQALARDAKGASPWIWQFRSARDVIAGRVFDAERFAFDDDGLRVTSKGVPFEIGLPLPHALDVRRFPNLRIDLSTDAPGTLQVVASPTLPDARYFTSNIALQTGARILLLNLTSTHWTSRDAAAMAPDKAAMLRLRVQLPAGAQLKLHAVALDRIAGARGVRLDEPATIHAMAPNETKAQLQALAASIDVHDTPVLELPKSWHIEGLRRLLDAIGKVIPAAIVLPHGAAAAAFAQARAPDTQWPAATMMWWILLAYAFALVLLRCRPPRNPRWRATLELLFVLSAPLWLIIGGHYTGVIDAQQGVLIACVAAFVISLGWPRDWNWNASTRTWILALAVVAFAGAIGWIGHAWSGAPPRGLDGAQALRYFGWALIQQFFVCVVCTSRWQRITKSRAVAAYLGALGFALMHTPNAALMLATFVGGLCWCTLYLRERALLPLAISHAASAVILISLLPPDWLYSAEVSARYFQ